jgi:hypothetical protein
MSSRRKQALGGGGVELQLDLHDDDNKLNNLFDSGGRYVDTFVGVLNSVTADVNHVAVKLNWGRVLALGKMPGRCA